MGRLFNAAVLGLILSSNAFADQSFVGKWKAVEIKCASGKPASLENESLKLNKLDVTAELTPDRYESKVDFSFTVNKSSFAEARKELDKAAATLRDLPDSPEKRSAVAAIRKSRDTIAEYSARTSCSTISRGTYVVHNSKMYTNELNNLSTCTSEDDGIDESIDLEKSTVEIRGNRLVVTGGQELEKDAICNIGDRSIMIFERVQ